MKKRTKLPKQNFTPMTVEYDYYRTYKLTRSDMKKEINEVVLNIYDGICKAVSTEVSVLFSVSEKEKIVQMFIENPFKVFNEEKIKQVQQTGKRAVIKTFFFADNTEYELVTSPARRQSIMNHMTGKKRDYFTQEVAQGLRSAD